VAALRDFNLGITLQRDARILKRKSNSWQPQRKTQLCARFFKARSSDALLGYDGDAEESAKEAVGLSQDLPTQRST